MAQPSAAGLSRGAVPLVDRARLRDVENIASDSGFLAKLLEGFFVDAETLLTRLEDVATNGRFADVPDVTHAIKGAALGIGAQQLGARCADIDQAAAQGDLTRVQSLVGELRKCFVATASQLRSYSQDKQRAS